MKPRFLFVPALLCLSILIANTHAGSAQQVQPLEPEWLQKMYAEGWTKVQEGVLQRDTGGGQFETFSFGAEGLQWVVQDYQQRVRHLENRYNQAPAAHLAVVVARLKGEIARLSEEIAVAPSASTVDDQPFYECLFSWGSNAYAGPQSGGMGVTATASADVHGDCDFSADTFAMAYAHAIDGTVETTVIQNDPKNNGTGWVSSHATASANGSTGCESAAQASATSSDLSLYYQTPYVQNFTCSTKLTLDPRRITLDGPQSDGDPSLLADEQTTVGEPRAGSGNHPTTTWKTTHAPHVNAAIIDLGAYYQIERVYLYDTHGAGGGTVGDFTVSYRSSNSGWTTLVSDPLDQDMIWKGFPNDSSNDQGTFVDDPTLEFRIWTRYLRVVNPTAYLGMPEIVIYGVPMVVENTPHL
ncbi:MAG TPA: discoidin domain-containing protein [Thermoanaerobaculia bacterium]|nr:discoidin domain-containing protein [Thermoanaerobaculia bacterium]